MRVTVSSERGRNSLMINHFIISSVGTQMMLEIERRVEWGEGGGEGGEDLWKIKIQK